VYDVDRARQLLEEAGYGDGFTIPIALTQRSYSGTPAVGEAVCLMWEQINVTCEQQRMAMTAFRPTFVARTGEGFNTHDNSPAEEPIAAYSNIISSKGLINFGAEHPWLDEMVAKAEKTGDFEKRMEIQREIAKFIHKNVIHIPIATINVVWPIGPEIDVCNMGCCSRDIASNLEYVPHRGQLEGRALP
jgi:peptide/nickel transport system substrate-binding protein